MEHAEGHRDVERSDSDGGAAPQGLNTEIRLGLSAKDPPAVVLGLLAGVRLHGDPNMPNAVRARAPPRAAATCH